MTHAEEWIENKGYEDEMAQELNGNLTEVWYSDLLEQYANEKVKEAIEKERKKVFADCSTCGREVMAQR